MDVEQARKMLLRLPYVAETLQWGDNLVFWVGDKAVGGKMFVLMDLQRKQGPVVSFAAGPERAMALLEREGFRPAPYLARAHWVAADDWDRLCLAEWRDELQAAHTYVLGRLPRRVREALETPATPTPATEAGRPKER